jgi:hypothetical protein
MSDRSTFTPDIEARRSWIASSAEKLSQALCPESFSGYRRAGYALLAVFVMLEMMLIVGGAPPIDEPWDMNLLLGGGWRIVSGQVPHTDFHNPIGPLTYLLVAFGMKVAAPSTSSIAYGSVLLLAILLPWAWYIASARLPWGVALIFVAFAGFFLVSPRPPGFGIRETSYAMIYNRQAYVLLSMLLLAVFLKPWDSAKRSVSVEGLFVGVLLTLLLYCKITYFLTAAVLTALAVVLDGRPLRWFLSSAGAFVGMCVAFFAAFHINLHSYLLDIATAGYSQSPAMRITLLSRSVTDNTTGIYILCFCVGLWTWAEHWAGRPRSSALRLWLVAGGIVAGAWLIISGNAAQYRGEDPLYFVAAVVLLELFRRRNAAQVTQSGSTFRLVYTASLVLMLPIFGGTILARDVASCAYVIGWDVARRPAFAESQRMHSASLRDFYVPPSSGHTTVYWPAREYPARINDGIDLLQKYWQKNDRVTTIGYADPFSFAMGSAPARDWLLWWRPNFSYDRAHHPPAEAFLGDATLVMVPLAGADAAIAMDTVEPLLGLYGDYLRAHFHELASTDTWVLYRRNSDYKLFQN